MKGNKNQCLAGGASLTENPCVRSSILRGGTFKMPAVPNRMAGFLFGLFAQKSHKNPDFWTFLACSPLLPFNSYVLPLSPIIPYFRIKKAQFQHSYSTLKITLPFVKAITPSS